MEDETSEAEALLLNDVVRGHVDFNGLPAIRSNSGCWKSASFIIGVGVAEKFTYFGISSNLISYLTGPMGQSTAAAAANVNAWNGAAMLLPLIGAFIADSFLGRYRMITVASLLYILGLGFMTLSVVFHSFNSSECKNDAYNLACSPPTLEVVFLFFSLYLVAFAHGGHQPCLQALGADQFDEEDEEELKSKGSFFNWWYFSISGGVLVAQLILSYIQENLSWELGFGIPCIIMCFALLVFVLGSLTYRFRISSNERNPFVRLARLFVKSPRNWFSDENVCSVDEADDAKEILRLIPIWFTCLAYAIVFSQSSTLFLKQGATMDRSIAYGFQIPAASLQAFTGLSILVFIPIYDRVFVPFTRAITKEPTGISMLQRIGVGLFLSVILMIISALVEKQRLSSAIEHGLVDKPTEIIPMSVWWLTPQYLLLGIANVFAVVGLQEFFYDQVRNELKSIGMALNLSILGVGSFLSSLLISVIEMATSKDGHDSWFSDNLNRAHLDYFYWLLAGLSAVSMAAYLYFAHVYVHRKKDNV